MTLTPEQIAQLVSVYGPTGTVIIIALVAYLTRTKRAEPVENPVMAKLEDINARLIRVETILEERK